MTIEWTERYTPRPWSSSFGDTPRGGNRAYLEIHLQAVIKWTQRCTPRLWSSEFGDTVGGHDGTSLEICTWSPWSCELAGRNRASLEIHLEARNQARLDRYLEAIDGRRPGTQFISSLTCNRGNATRWLYLWSSNGELASSGWSVGRYARSWSYIQRSTRHHENEGTTDNLRCMLYSVYAALSVNSWWWHGETERDDLTLCSCNDGRVVYKKREMGDEDENDMEDMSGYEIWGVWLAWLRFEDLIWVVSPARSGLVHAISGIVNWLVHKIL